jgi:hypothetical protein
MVLLLCVPIPPTVAVTTRTTMATTAATLAGLPPADSSRII